MRHAACLLWLMMAGLAAASVPANQNRAHFRVAQDGAADWNAFKWGWQGFDQQEIRVSFDQHVTNGVVVLRLNAEPYGDVHAEIGPFVVQNNTNAVLTLASTNLLPAALYSAQFALINTNGGYRFKSLAKGRVTRVYSLWDMTNYVGTSWSSVFTLPWPGAFAFEEEDPQFRDAAPVHEGTNWLRVVRHGDGSIISAVVRNPDTETTVLNLINVGMFASDSLLAVLVNDGYLRGADGQGSVDWLNRALVADGISSTNRSLVWGPGRQLGIRGRVDMGWNAFSNAVVEHVRVGPGGIDGDGGGGISNVVIQNAEARGLVFGSGGQVSVEEDNATDLATEESAFRRVYSHALVLRDAEGNAVAAIRYTNGVFVLSGDVAVTGELSADSWSFVEEDPAYAERRQFVERLAEFFTWVADEDDTNITAEAYVGRSSGPASVLDLDSGTVRSSQTNGPGVFVAFYPHQGYLSGAEGQRAIDLVSRKLRSGDAGDGVLSWAGNKLWLLAPLDGGGQLATNLHVSGSTVSNSTLRDVVIDGTEAVLRTDLVPYSPRQGNIGSLEKPFYRLYVAGGSVVIDGLVMSGDTNTMTMLVSNNFHVAGTLSAGNLVEHDPAWAGSSQAVSVAVAQAGTAYGWGDHALAGYSRDDSVHADVTIANTNSLGATIITNGTFTGSASWWALSNAVYSANRVHCPFGLTAVLTSVSNSTISSGAVYRVSLQRETSDSGESIGVYLGGHGTSWGAGPSTTLVALVHAQANGPVSVVVSATNDSVYIDNVTVQEVLAGDAWVAGVVRARDFHAAGTSLGALDAEKVSVSVFEGSNLLHAAAAQALESNKIGRAEFSSTNAAQAATIAAAAGRGLASVMSADNDADGRGVTNSLGITGPDAGIHVDTVNGVLWSAVSNPAVNWVTGTLTDSNLQQSVVWRTRTLYDEDGLPVVVWSGPAMALQKPINMGGYGLTGVGNPAMTSDEETPTEFSVFDGVASVDGEPLAVESSLAASAYGDWYGLTNAPPAGSLVIESQGSVSLTWEDSGDAWTWTNAVDGVHYHLPVTDTTARHASYVFNNLTTNIVYVHAGTNAWIDSGGLGAYVYSGSYGVNSNAFSRVEVALVGTNRWMMTGGRKEWTPVLFP